MTAPILLAVLTAAAAATVLAWRRRAWPVVAGLIPTTVGLAWWFWHAAAVGLLVALAATAVLSVMLVWYRVSRTASRVVRFGERARRKAGVASTWDIARHASAYTVRRKAPVVRPSLAGLPRARRLRLRTAEAGVELCRAGPLRVWCSTEDAVLVAGGPRTGKTGLLAARILDAPGAVISTSTRRDLLTLTGPHRATDDRPVYVYNPAGLGGVESTLAFNPLDGCADARRATETAHDMIPESEGDAERWDAQARRVLAVLLHAAALAELPIAVIAEWLGDVDAAGREITGALRRSPDAAQIEVARQFLDLNHRTRSSITGSVMPALEWLTAPDAVAATTGSGDRLDVADLVARRGSLYLLGRHEAHTAPLLGALTGRIIREARRLAAHQPGGRLDPPLSLALDEAARIAPINLPDLSGDCGGSGIALTMVFQSRADISDRWGVTGAGRLITNTAARVLFGGTADAGELRAWSELAGERDERVSTYDAHGRVTGTSTHKVPVLPAPLLANPGPGRVVLFHRDIPPVLGRATMGWRRRRVRNTLGWRLVGARVSRWRAAAAPAPAVCLPPAGAPAPAPPEPVARPAGDPHPAGESAGDGPGGRAGDDPTRDGADRPVSPAEHPVRPGDDAEHPGGGR